MEATYLFKQNYSRSSLELIFSAIGGGHKIMSVNWTAIVWQDNVFQQLCNLNMLTGLDLSTTYIPRCTKMNLNQLPLRKKDRVYWSDVFSRGCISYKLTRQHKRRIAFCLEGKKADINRERLTNRLELSFLDVFAFPNASSIQLVSRISVSTPPLPPPRPAKYCIAIFAVSVFPAPLSPL